MVPEPPAWSPKTPLGQWTITQNWKFWVENLRNTQEHFVKNNVILYLCFHQNLLLTLLLTNVVKFWFINILTQKWPSFWAKIWRQRFFHPQKICLRCKLTLLTLTNNTNPFSSVQLLTILTKSLFLQALLTILLKVSSFLVYASMWQPR